MRHPTAPYHPIACSLHDELQLRAMRGSDVTIRYVSRDGVTGAEAVTDTADRIVDVRTRDGAEFIALANGIEIRLDQLLEVDGIPFGADDC